MEVSSTYLIKDKILLFCDPILWVKMWLKFTSVHGVWEMEDVTWEEFLPAATGFKRPCGIELNANRLFVSDYETGEIRCFDINTKQELGKINTGKKGIMGVTLGPDQKLYYVNALANEVLRIDPQN